MKKNLTILFVSCALFYSFNANAASSGICGATASDCSYTLDDNGLLTITGSGTMDNYAWNGAPWFSEATSITSVSISEGIQNLGNYALARAINLTSISIPDSVRTIGNDTFYDNRSLTSLTFGENSQLTYFGAEAFTKTGLIEHFEIPRGVTSITAAAFQYAKLKSITIPDTVTSIGFAAFDSVYNLTALVIPDSVTDIAQLAFSATLITDLSASSENLQRYLDAGGKFRSGDLNISCSSGDCMAVLEAWDAAHNTTYASRANITAKSQQIHNADGSTSVYENGQLVATRGKRIYTVEEASRLSKETGNTFKLRYK